MQPISIYTLDKIKIAALWWDRDAAKSVLLLHMMPATKESYIPLAEELCAKGFNVLAIDFRGHGESGETTAEASPEEDVPKYFMDARAALSWLEDTHKSNAIGLVGASIGANIALQCLKHDHVLKRAVCLSAGLDYYGVKAMDFVTELQPDQAVLFVGSKDDVRKSGIDCATQAEQLYKRATGKKEKIIFDTGGHGTDMWEHHPELIDKIVSFLS
jgi:alpha-beta hydrolase superfamily lysophospholipase